MPAVTPLEAEYREWLVTRLSGYLRRPENDINVCIPFSEYGMDSVAALSLFGDIEDAFGLYLEPTVAWDYPTIEALARFLVRAGKDGEL
ncbi:acyl carrier protein [Streptacidiphilus neutrinimicus]|uniref:acyl carrier protein n=1 Tax=Streptacidiphilus neutrinimicus TaxID=105420 RepID=UPI0005A685D0|nr:acyl carrier protein [Streptacidiphilus neutrinimicus]